MEQTSAVDLAMEYMRLGGHKRVKLDDNHITTRQWEQDTPEAEAFWNKNIEPLDARRRQEVVTHLPSI